MFASKHDAIESKLSYRFYSYFGLVVIAQAMNSFCVIFHMFDTAEDVEDTARFKLGQITYFTFFFLQTFALLIGTYIFAWVIYIRLAVFLKPVSEEEATSDDDRYENLNMSRFERNRDVLRRKFRSKYLSLNIHFIYLLVTLTLRTGTYVGLRLSSKVKMLEWTFIKPSVFYLTYTTDLMIVAGVMYFIISSAPLRSTKGSEEVTGADAIIFPKEANGDRINDTESRRSSQESEVDGDALIQARLRRRSGSESSD